MSYFKFIVTDWKSYVIISIALLIGIGAAIEHVYFMTIFMAIVVLAFFIGNHFYWSRNLKGK